MKKIFLIIFGIIFAIIILSFIFFFGFSNVSTNKGIYEVGEEVIVSFSDFRLFRCNTSPNINFYYRTSEGWDKITHTTPITFGRSFCVDGKLTPGAYPADVVSCCILCKPFLSGEYIWSSQIYEKKDEKEICGDIPEPILSYRLKLAPPGKYKIEFGRAQTIFEIKGTMPEKVSEDETANWKTYSNSIYNIELKYPDNWQLKEEVAYAHTYEGTDGFFQISAVSGDELTINDVCGNEAYHKLEPYGSQPKIEKLKAQNQEACLILPSGDQPEVMKNQAALIIHYPQPILVSGESYNYFILWADQNHINEISKTLRFIKDETANWNTYRDEEHGFEIKYPEKQGISFFKIIVDAEREFLFGTIVCMEGEEATVLDKIRFSPRIEVGASYFEELGRKPTEEECDTLAPRFVISGRFCADKNLTKYQVYCEEGSETSDYHRYDVFLACDGENFKGKEGRVQCNQIFNQILSTFRFLE